MIIAGLDIETTGLEWAEGHRIIELAALLYDESGSCRHEWVQRVNPQRPIDPKAQAVHGITFEMVAHEPTFDKVAPRLAKLLGGVNLVVAHNGREFDLPFIKAELTRVGVACPEVALIDTIDARWATPFGKPPNLGELCFATGVPYDPAQAHSAGYDVRVMMEAFFAARRFGFLTQDAMKRAA